MMDEVVEEYGGGGDDDERGDKLPGRPAEHMEDRPSVSKKTTFPHSKCVPKGIQQ